MLTFGEPLNRLLFFKPYSPLPFAYQLLQGSMWRTTLRIMTSVQLVYSLKEAIP